MIIIIIAVAVIIAVGVIEYCTDAYDNDWYE